MICFHKVCFSPQKIAQVVFTVVIVYKIMRYALTIAFTFYIIENITQPFAQKYYTI